MTENLKCWIKILVICTLSFIFCIQNSSGRNYPGFSNTMIKGLFDYGSNKDLSLNRLNQDSKAQYILKGFYFNFQGGIDLTDWVPRNKVTDNDPIVKTSAEGLSAYVAKGEIGYHNTLSYKGISKNLKFTIFSFSYEGPFQKTESQKAIFDEREFKTRGVEQIMGLIDLRGIFLLLKFPEKMTILGLRYKYTREVFQGTTTALQDFAFMPRGSEAVYDPDNDRTLAMGLIPYSVDDVLSYQSVFVDQEYTIPVSEKPGKDDKGFLDYRIGIFRSDWRRPSNNDPKLRFQIWDEEAGVMKNLPVVFDSRYQSTGLVFAKEDLVAANHFFFNYQMRLGLKNKLVISDAVDEIYKPGNGFHVALKFDAGYRLSVGKELERVNGMVGISYDSRTFIMNYKHYDLSTKDTDYLFKVYLRLNMFL